MARREKMVRPKITIPIKNAKIEGASDVDHDGDNGGSYGRRHYLRAQAYDGWS